MATFYTDSASFNSLQVTGSVNVSSSAAIALRLRSSGSTIFSVSGSSSELFNISDVATSNLFSISSGSTGIFSVDNTRSVIISGSLITSGSMRVIGTGSLTGSMILTGSLIAAGDSNVGIGTTTPAVKLHVSGAGSEAVRINGTGTTGIVIQAGSLTGGPGRIELNAGTNNNSNVRVGSTYIRESSGFLIVANALVGAPTATLQARGSGATAATKNFLIQNSTPVDILTISDDKSVQISGSVLITGSLLMLPSSSFTLPTTQSASPSAGTAYFSNNFLYVYNGSAWKSASLS